MTSALYIGPYRQNNYIGLESSIYLRSIHKNLLNKNIKLYTRPYYTHLEYRSSVDDQQYTNLEVIDNTAIFPDTIIQHGYIEHLCVRPHTKNIAIPILNPRLVKTSEFNHIQKLNLFNHIIVGEEEDKTLLIKSGINKPIHIIYEDIKSYISDINIINGCYNYHAIDNNKYNFMFIGEYITNIEIIQNIMFAFISAMRSSDNCILRLILRGTEHNKKAIEDFYKKILKQLHIINPLNNIKFYFNELDIKNIFAALNSADCLISLNQDYNQKLYSNYILSQNKKCLSFKNLNWHSSPCSLLSEEYSIDDYIKHIDMNNLISSFIKHSEATTNIEKKYKTPNTQTIGKIICGLI